MNGTQGIRRWLQGTLVALGAALALTSVGCVAQTGDTDPDDDESIGSADQELEPIDEQPGANGGGIEPGAEVMLGDENKDPQPQPWRGAEIANEGQDPTPGGPDPEPYHNMSSTPSNGHDGT